MFPPVKVSDGSAKQRAERSLRNALRRECRGIIFDNETGALLRRPYHKFFNVNERPETMKLDLTRGHTVYDKLDGSMIVPFMLNDELIWGTKMVAPDFHELIKSFVKNSSIRYIDFCNECIQSGYSPIFEWLCREKRIVLDYGPESNLVLTAIRHMETGQYLNISSTI
jgi:RNA ligase